MRARSVVQVVLNLAEGGMETMAVNLSVALKSRGHAVTVIALDGGGRHEETLHQHGIPWHALGGRRLSDPRKHYQLGRMLRTAGPDVVHTHHFSPLLHTAAAATWAGWLPIVHTEHSGQYLRRRPDYRAVLAALSLRCRWVVLVGRAMWPFYRKELRISSRRLRVIPNGVSQAGGSAGTDRAILRSALGLPPGFLVLSAGRLYPVKRYEDLLTAIALARPQVPDLQLALLGIGPEQRRLERLGQGLGIGDAVHFPGWRQDVMPWLACADLFALTSESEGLPMAVLEAMAAGLPVVSTAVGDLPEVLGEGQAGMLVPVGSPRKVADAIIALAHDPQIRAELAQAGRARVRELYTLDRMVESYLSLYAMKS